MRPAGKQPAAGAIWEQSDAELVCLLCGETVGEVFGTRLVHKAGCERPLGWLGGRPRCCQCGGPLICDPTANLWSVGPAPPHPPPVSTPPDHPTGEAATPEAT